MRFSLISLPLLLGATTAQVTGITSPTITAASTSTPSTTSSSASTTTDLASLVALLPTCALSCFVTAAKDISCAPTDFSCLCSSASALVTKIGPCIYISSGCSSSDISNVTSLAPKICSAVNKNATGAAVSAASSIVSTALATVTGTQTASGNGAARTEGAVMGYGIGVLGGGLALALMGL
ncbi:hypothetical protein DL546_006725 [Coniochaeta pulveracea]|uniref:CFEM domain-containing protein n=1 Tax=Coniochaeta pulveracea TaxID=177199 RepID=A0A420Y5Y5_9PEZI|nr:hypothetical protein DL546_006725 [Coniochaeta pulveracea]